MSTISLYVDRTLSVEAALVQLAYFKASDQWSFHTDAAMERLLLRERTVL
jgi:hypothetical protein